MDAITPSSAEISLANYIFYFATAIVALFIITHMLFNIIFVLFIIVVSLMSSVFNIVAELVFYTVQFVVGFFVEHGK